MRIQRGVRTPLLGTGLKAADATSWQITWLPFVYVLRTRERLDSKVMDVFIVALHLYFNK